jgi:hypothetical protein
VPTGYVAEMSVVGFRCSKDALACVVLDGTRDEPHLIEHHHIRVPKGSRGDQLVWVRKEVQEILHRTRPTAVAFKATEPIARTKDMGRAEVEGVLQEGVRDVGLDPARRTWAGIKADLGFDPPARYLPTVLEGDLAALPANRREAALAALSAIARA